MAGHVVRPVAQELLGSIVEHVSPRTFHVELHEVEPADEDVGLKPLLDVQDALVRAAAEEGTSPPLRHQQVLLVPEVVGHELAARAHREPKGVDLVRWHPVVAREELEPVSQVEVVIRKDEPARLLERRVEADVLLPGVPVLLEGMAAEVDQRMVVELEEGREAAAVVVVAVRDDHGVDRAEVDAKPSRVVREGGRLTRVEEDRPRVRLHEEAQPVLGDESLSARRVLRKRRDAHLGPFPHTFSPTNVAG